MSFLLKQTVDENYAFKRSQRMAKNKGQKLGIDSKNRSSSSGYVK